MLNARKGNIMFNQYKAWYRGAWGDGPRMLVTVTGIGTKNGKIVLDCKPDNGGYERWGYVDQFEPLENSDS